MFDTRREGMPMTHGFAGYVHGCKCRVCLDGHAARQRQYRAEVKIRTDAMKAEFSRLQAFEQRMLAALGQGEQATP